jgi:hypothetical protein
MLIIALKNGHFRQYDNRISSFLKKQKWNWLWLQVLLSLHPNVPTTRSLIRIEGLQKELRGANIPSMSLWFKHILFKRKGLGVAIQRDVTLSLWVFTTYRALRIVHLPRTTKFGCWASRSVCLLDKQTISLLFLNIFWASSINLNLTRWISGSRS